MISWLWGRHKKPEIRSERRASQRYLCNADADLRWHDATGQVREARVLVLDVSMLGSSVLMEDLPQGAVASIRLRNDPTSDWLDAEIVEIQATSEGPYLIRLQFPGGTSYHFFRSALLDLDRDGAGPTYESSQFDPRDWR